METITTSVGAVLLSADNFRHESDAKKKERENREKLLATIPKTTKMIEEDIMETIRESLHEGLRSCHYNFKSYSATLSSYSNTIVRQIAETVQKDFQQAGYTVTYNWTETFPQFSIQW